MKKVMLRSSQSPTRLDASPDPEILKYVFAEECSELVELCSPVYWLNGQRFQVFRPPF
jgi:hypothetical protein